MSSLESLEAPLPDGEAGITITFITCEQVDPASFGVMSAVPPPAPPPPEKEASEEQQPAAPQSSLKMPEAFGLAIGCTSSST